MVRYPRCGLWEARWLLVRQRLSEVELEMKWLISVVLSSIYEACMKKGKETAVKERKLKECELQTWYQTNDQVRKKKRQKAKR